jgi:hypothetical protein
VFPMAVAWVLIKVQDDGDFRERLALTSTVGSCSKNNQHIYLFFWGDTNNSNDTNRRSRKSIHAVSFQTHKLIFKPITV